MTPKASSNRQTEVGKKGERVPALLHMLPLAVAVAISSVPIMVTLFILLSANRARSALPFMTGWVVGIAIAVCLGALLARAVPTSKTERHADTALGIAEIVVGIALVGLGIFSWFHSRGKESSSGPKWLSSGTKLGPWQSLGLGLLLNARPKGILLAIAAGLTLQADAKDPPLAVVAVVLYTIVAASTVAVPIIATSAAPTRMEPRLVSARGWLARNGHTLTAVILVLVGLIVVWMGIERL